MDEARAAPDTDVRYRASFSKAGPRDKRLAGACQPAPAEQAAREKACLICLPPVRKRSGSYARPDHPSDDGAYELLPSSGTAQAGFGRPPRG
jgi:hypothetical protein